MMINSNFHIWFRGCLLVFVILLFGSAHAAETSRKPIQFDIQTIPGVERYVDLLAYPAYIAVALENNGDTISSTGRLLFLDGRTFRFKGVLLKFIEKKGSTYKYLSNIEWGINFDVPVEIDTASINSGRILVRIYPPLADLFPQALLSRGISRAQAMAHVNIQKKMVAYLDGMAKDQSAEQRMNAILSQILVEGYNNNGKHSADCTIREPGDAEPLSDQMLLIVTLAIWVVIVPLGVVTFLYLKRERRRSRS